MSLPFNPATDIYADSDYAQQVVNQYQGNQYYVPGFNSGDSQIGFGQHYGRGYYRFEDNRSGPMALASTAASILRGKRSIPFNERSLGQNLDVYANSRAYSQGRMHQLQMAAMERADRMARNVALQRNQFYGAEQQARLERMFSNAAMSVMLSGAQAVMPSDTFEAMFGRAGSGMGMYDSAYSQSTYRLGSDGSRWTPGQRLRYASQATSMLYQDPVERSKRLYHSVQGGELWTGLEAMGLLGGNDADYFDRPQEETVKSAIEYFRDTEVSPFASPQTRDLHEKVQKRQAINDRRRELSDLQDIINSPLDDEQKLEAIREYRQKSSELLRLEKDSGTDLHTRTDSMPADMGKAVSAMKDLQAHYNKRTSYGRDQEGFDKETERLALIAQKEIIDANLGAASGHSIDLNNLGDDQTRQRIVSSLERAQGTRDQYIRAEQQAKAGVTEKDVDANANRYIREAQEKFSEIVNDPDRDAGMQNSRRLDELLIKAQKVFEIQARNGTEEEVAEARRKAIEAAGGGATGELVLQMANRSLLGESLDLHGDDEQTRDVIRRRIQENRNSVAEGTRHRIDEELLRGGFKSKDLDVVDLTELPLDEIVSLSDAIIAAQDDPRLTEWLKNSAMINSKKGRWAEYEKAIKALQESITDRNASPAKLLETLNNFAGGNLHQMDTVQLKRTVQQTYALARQLGQGDEYVEASMGQSQQMLAALGVNRAFTGWHGMQGLAHKAAVLENPEYLGVWGAQTSAETTATADSHRAAWLKSNVANQWGAALNVQQMYGNFREGSSADNYMKALERGDSTFERIYTDQEGNRKTETWSVQMSEAQWRQIIPESLDTDDPERIKAARSQMGAVLSNRSANQKAIHDNQELAATVQHSQASAQFTTGVAMASRASTARGYVNQKAAELTGQQGVTSASRGRIMQQVYLEMADRMLDSDEVQRIVRDYGIDREDPYFIGKIGAVMQQEEFQRILQTADVDSDEYKVAQTYLQLMENEKDRDEMAVPIQHLLDEIGLNTGHQNAVGAMKNLSRKVASRQRVHVAVASEEQRRKDAYTEGFSSTVLTRIADSLGEGETFEEIVNAAFQMIEMDPESDLMQAHRDFTEANARVRKLEIERDQITRNRNISDEERQKLLDQNETRMKSAVQNLGDAQANLQPELRKMRLGFERMSTAEFDSRFGMDLDLLNQVVTVEDPLTGKFKLRKLQKDEVRMDAETGIVQVREGHDWVEKQDASYFAQMTRKTEEGEEEHYFKELFRDNGRWKYRTDDGTLVEFDPTAEGAKMAVGTKILTRAQDGSVKATNYQWTNGFLTRTTGDGMTTSVVQDAEGNYISMDSEIGKAIYSSSEDGILNQDLIAAIEANQSNLVTVLSQKDLQIGAGARRHAATAADETKDSVREEKIHDLANQYVDSTGAIGRIDPVKVEMEGETFYMLTGFADKERREQELADYRQEVTKQQEEISAYFEADDSDAKNFEQHTNEELRETRKAYRANQEIRQRIQGRIRANREKLETPLSEDEAKQVRLEIEKDRKTLEKLEPVARQTIEQAAKEQARFARIDVQSEHVREISEESISTTISDPKLLAAIYKHGGQAVKDLDQSREGQTFTAPELSNIIGNLREAAKTLPASEQGVLDVHIDDLVKKKEAVQRQADKVLQETFSGQGGSGVDVVRGKTSDPVKTDRFGNPIAITPVPRKDSQVASDPTQPTDIKQLQIGASTYDAATGIEQNTPVRPPVKIPFDVLQEIRDDDIPLPTTAETPKEVEPVKPVASAITTKPAPDVVSPPETAVADLSNVPDDIRKRAVKTIDISGTTTEKSKTAIEKTENVQRSESTVIATEQSDRIPRKKGLETESVLSIDRDDVLMDEKADQPALGTVSGQAGEEMKSSALDAPAVSRVGGDSISRYGGIGQFDKMKDCTLHADTVHFNVASMDLKNGSVVVESFGRGHRNGTSEQR